MNYILFVMFLVAPPGQKDPDWALQSTNSMEFADFATCESAAKEILKSMKKTSTITMVAWCFDKEHPPTAAGAPVGGARKGTPAEPSSRLNLR